MKVTAKHKYATIGFIYLFGLICASFLESIACFVIFAVMAVLFALSVNGRDLFLKLSIFFMGMSFLISGLYSVAYIEPARQLDGQKAVVSAVVEECRYPDNDSVYLLLSGTADSVPLKLTLFADDADISAGDKIEFEAVFSRFSDTAEFSESGYYFSKGIFVKAYAVSDISVTKGRGGIREYVSYISDYFKNTIDTSFADGGGGMVKAVLFGDKSGLSEKNRTDMTRSGISHLAAVSGTHLSIMVHMFSAFIGIFIKRKGKPFFMIVSGYILFLMLFFGMTASVMRSGFMMLIFYGSVLLRRKSDTLSSVGAALLIILAVNPCACRDMGLLMSVAGTVGLGVVSPAVAEKLKIHRKNTAANMILDSLCASLCTMPLGALCFGGISAAAPLTTVLVQPFFTVILTAVPISLLLPFLSYPLMLVSGFSSEIMTGISAVAGGFQYSFSEIDGRTTVIFLLLVVSGAVLTAFISGRVKSVALFTVLMVVALGISQTIYGIISYDDITVKIIADSSDTVLCVEDKTGVSFYMLNAGGKAAETVNKYSTGEKADFICIASETGSFDKLSGLCGVLHTPENGNMQYDVSGEYTVIAADGEILLDIRGVTVGLLPAGSETQCDLSIYCGYRKNYGSGGKTATILCDKKYYNCGEAVNAFLHKTEIIVNSEGMYALSVE